MDLLGEIHKFNPPIPKFTYLKKGGGQNIFKGTGNSQSRRAEEEENGGGKRASGGRGGDQDSGNKRKGSPLHSIDTLNKRAREEENVEGTVGVTVIRGYTSMQQARVADKLAELGNALGVLQHKLGMQDSPIHSPQDHDDVNITVLNTLIKRVKNIGIIYIYIYILERVIDEKQYNEETLKQNLILEDLFSKGINNITINHQNNGYYIKIERKPLGIL